MLRFWAGKIVPAIRTFLVNNDFSDKKVAFFVSVGGDKPKKALKNMSDLISPKIPSGKLGIINSLKNLEEIND